MDELHVQMDNPYVARFYTGNFSDQVSDEQKWNWHSSSRRIIHL